MAPARRARSGLAEMLQIGRHEEAVVVRGDVGVGLGERHLDQPEGRTEERPRAVHLPADLAVLGRHAVAEDVLDAEPRRQQQPRLRPGELPGNGPQRLQPAGRVRRAGRLPMCSASSSVSGVAKRKYSRNCGSS